MGTPLGTIDTQYQAPKPSGSTIDTPINRPMLAAPEKRFVEVPDIDPASGAATGSTTRMEMKAAKPFEPYPTIAEWEPGQAGLSFGSGAKMALGIPFTSNPQQLIDMLRANVPPEKLRITTDKYGNPMAEIEGKKYHLDRPDFNALDFSRGVIKSGAALPLAAGAAEAAPLAAGATLATVAQTGAGAISNLIEQMVTKAAGSKQPLSMEEAGVSGAMAGLVPIAGKGITSFAQLMAPDVFATLPRGVQNFIKDRAERLRMGEITPAQFQEDMMLDNPRMRSIASEIMLQDSPASDIIEKSLLEREGGRQARVASDITNNLGRQTTTDLEMDRALKEYKGVLNDQLGPILKEAPALDPSGVVAKIDSALETAKGDVRNALLNVRKMLVLEGGTPSTQGYYRPITTADGKVIRKEWVEGTPAKPPVFETSAQGLENARVAIDRLINYGDASIGISPKSLPKSGALGSVRSDLSDLLKENIDGYRQIMGKYSNVYDLIDANEAGTNIFARGKGQMRPEQVQEYLKNPETAAAFKNGVRQAWENTLRSNPNDIVALKKGLGGEGDYVRQNMELIYGPDAVDNLLAAAEREAVYKETAAKLLSARQAGIERIGPETTKSIEEPRVGELSQLPRKFVAEPINLTERMLRGESGPAFEAGRAQFLTAKGPQIGEYKSGFERAMERAAALKPVETVAPAIAPQAPDYVRSLNEAAGGRIGHASGGKAGVMTAEGLLRDLKRRKVMMANKTEQMLSLPDDAVVQALDAAKR